MRLKKLIVAAMLAVVLTGKPADACCGYNDGDTGFGWLSSGSYYTTSSWLAAIGIGEYCEWIYMQYYDGSGYYSNTCGGGFAWF